MRPVQALSSDPIRTHRMPRLLRLALSAEPGAIAFWRATLMLLLGLLSWLALTPAPPPEAGLLWDKLNHLSAFASLAVAGFLAFRGRWWQVALGLLAYGGLIEILQTFTPTRVGEWEDLLADAVGIVLGLLLAAGMAAGIRPAGAAS
jgi:VanZ family protein